MATTKTQKTTAKKLDKVMLLDAYIDYVLTHNKKPASVYTFCKDLNVEEGLFYQHFNSFDQMEDHQWVLFYRNTREVLEADPMYENFSVREKMLSFYFTWIEQLRKKRSFCVYYFNNNQMSIMTGKGLAAFREAFKADMKGLIIEGVSKEEIAGRSKLSDRYDDGFWMASIFLLRFWIEDQSAGFEKTDAAIEKTVNLAFDMISRGAIDSLFDFGKFMLNNRF
jgi:AcrR family transcriptional regulator